MCASLIVFVADPYRSEVSCAILSCLQQAEIRRSGRRRPVRFIFNPTGTPEPGLLQGADGAVLVLLESQKAAAERLAVFWKKLTGDQNRSVPVLPVVVRTGNDSAPENRLPLPVPCAASAVTVYQSDVFVEHGGLLSLSQSAETEIEQALRSVFHESGAAHTLHPTGVCPVSRIAGVMA